MSEFFRLLRDEIRLVADPVTRNNLSYWLNQLEEALQARIAALEAQLAERVKVEPLKTSASGTLNIDAAVACVMELFPGADRQALQCLASLMAKTAHPVSTASVTKARQAVERLANAKMDLTLSEWSELSSAILSAIEATPPAPKVTEARLLDAVASAIRNSEFVFGDERLTFKELMESAFGEDGQYAANAANIIVPQLAYRTLTAAQEAGKP